MKKISGLFAAKRRCEYCSEMTLKKRKCKKCSKIYTEKIICQECSIKIKLKKLGITYHPRICLPCNGQPLPDTRPSSQTYTKTVDIKLLDGSEIDIRSMRATTVYSGHTIPEELQSEDEDERINNVMYQSEMITSQPLNQESYTRASDEKFHSRTNRKSVEESKCRAEVEDQLDKSRTNSYSSNESDSQTVHSNNLSMIDHTGDHSHLDHHSHVELHQEQINHLVHTLDDINREDSYNNANEPDQTNEDENIYLYTNQTHTHNQEHTQFNSEMVPTSIPIEVHQVFPHTQHKLIHENLDTPVSLEHPTHSYPHKEEDKSHDHHPIKSQAKTNHPDPHHSHSQMPNRNSVRKNLQLIHIRLGNPEDEYEILKKVFIGIRPLWHIQHKSTLQRYHMKKVRAKSDKELNQINMELALITLSSTPYIISYKEAFIHHGSVCIITELIKTDLKSMVRSKNGMTESMISYCARDLIHGLKQLHSQYSIHRNLKTENIAFTFHNQIKLIEFGMLAQLTEEQALRSTVLGNPAYMAPELIKGFKYDMKVDIWSLGICLIELAEGKLPYANQNPMEILANILNLAPPKFKRQELWSGEFNDFIEICLKKEPNERPCIDELAEHPFIRKVTDSSKEEFEKYIEERLKMLSHTLI